MMCSQADVHRHSVANIITKISETEAISLTVILYRILPLLGDTHAHVPHIMNKCDCKTNLEINDYEQGYVAVKLLICIKDVLL